ncbi:MAG TPA: hypothetical protein PLL30_08985 [Candidatus Krumholzibacteria bacterium]|nr:hypothetical protein [Candidatus Krumholzibacteria bacterium]HPD71894.1 hypothetical protein [Candidatus Krumholzibacteria bacterium]HRY41173.1 hypothetical protein [Candidatus Krumholzibacteria bacterium]
MKLVIYLALALALGAGIAAAADEKSIDVNEYTIPEPGRIQITGALSTASPMWNRGFGTGLYSLACAFPLTDSGADGQYYDVYCVEATDQSPIEIVVNSNGTTIGDTTLFLYCDPFNPATPLANAVFYDDDDGVSLLSAFMLSDNIVLPPGTSYWLVISTFSGGITGSYAIDTSANVVLCGGVGAEATDWSSIKGLFR